MNHFDSKSLTATQLVAQLQLLPHPEGGFYKEQYRSVESIPASALPDRFSGSRPFGTAIYFLLEQGNFSAFHRIQSDECWHFYAGDPLEVLEITPEGELKSTLLGNDLGAGQVFQYIVPAGCWFGSRTVAGGVFSLVGCTVAPGFDFNDFELADKAALTADYPHLQSIIEVMCR